MTTAYNLTNIVIQSHNKSSVMSTSASITQFVFESSPRKKLFISVAIDAYNYYMDGIDIANQY